jgi:DNA-binding SARP family transcriptional activator
MLRYDVLPDWDDEWVGFERERFRQLRLLALETMCLRLRDEGRIAESLQVGTEAVFADPMRESAHRVLIATHLAQGNLGEAIRQYRTFLAIARDCGIPPSPLITRLMAGVARTKRPVRRPAAGTLPRRTQSRRMRRFP